MEGIARKVGSCPEEIAGKVYLPSKVLRSFPNEESCVRTMFGLAKHLNEDRKYKPIRGF